jgi:hypothetical protein
MWVGQAGHTIMARVYVNRDDDSASALGWVNSLYSSTLEKQDYTALAPCRTVFREERASCTKMLGRMPRVGCNRLADDIVL